MAIITCQCLQPACGSIVQESGEGSGFLGQNNPAHPGRQITAMIFAGFQSGAHSSLLFDEMNVQ